MIKSHKKELLSLLNTMSNMADLVVGMLYEGEI